MSVRKILIDFSEYQRLLHIEKHYEELSKQKKEDIEGKGDISLLLATKKKALETPLITELESITVPPIAKFDTSHESKRPPTEKFILDKWYQIGRPV